jgi:hypothetical protein
LDDSELFKVTDSLKLQCNLSLAFSTLCHVTEHGEKCERTNGSFGRKSSGAAISTSIADEALLETIEPMEADNPKGPETS